VVSAVVRKAERGAERPAPVAPRLIACTGVSATLRLVVREGGLRVVVAADLSARPPRRVHGHRRGAYLCPRARARSSGVQDRGRGGL